MFHEAAPTTRYSDGLSMDVNDVGRALCIGMASRQKAFVLENKMLDEGIRKSDAAACHRLALHAQSSRVLYAIKTKTMRLDHNIHATSQLKVVASREPWMITLIAVLAALVSQEMLADRCNIVKTITVFAVGTEVAEDLW